MEEVWEVSVNLDFFMEYLYISIIFCIGHFNMETHTQMGILGALEILPDYQRNKR